MVPLAAEVGGRVSGDGHAEGTASADARAFAVRYARGTTIRSCASLIVALFLALAGPAAQAAGIDCAKAATATEHTICNDAVLRTLDASLAADFSDALTATQGAVRQALLAQQRRWIAERDHACPAGDAACLQSSYQQRLDALEALTARVSPGNPTLSNATSVALIGKWKVDGYLTPSAPGRGVTSAEKPRYLPASGSTISGRPGKLCSQDGECLPYGLDQEDFPSAPGTGELHLPPSTPYYVAYLAGKSVYGLIMRPDGSLLAQFQVCDKTYTACTSAFQVWRPASPDAAVRVLAR